MLPTQTGDQLAIAVVVLDLLDRLHLGPADRPRRRGRRARRGRGHLLPAARTWPPTRPRSWPSGSPTPTRCCGAAPCSLRAPPGGSPSRSDARPAARPWPPTPSTCCPCSSGPRRPTCSPTRSPTAAPSGARRCSCSTTGHRPRRVTETRDRLSRRRGRPASAWRRSPPRPPATWRATPRCSPPAPTPRRTSSSGPRGMSSPCRPKAEPRRSSRRCWPTPASPSRSSSRSR